MSTQTENTEGMVRAQWVGGPLGPMDFIGAVSHKNYGRRARNDIFWLYEADFRANGDQFVEVNAGGGFTPTGEPASPELMEGATVTTAPAPRGNQASAQGFAAELDKLSPDEQQRIINEAIVPGDYVGVLYPSDPTEDDLTTMAAVYDIDTFDVKPSELRNRINAQLTARYMVVGEETPEEFAGVQPVEGGQGSIVQPGDEPAMGDDKPATLQTEGMVLGTDWPDTSWTKANIQAFADAHGVDLKGASTQANMLKSLGPMRKL